MVHLSDVDLVAALDKRIKAQSVRPEAPQPETVGDVILRNQLDRRIARQRSIQEEKGAISRGLESVGRVGEAAAAGFQEGFGEAPVIEEAAPLPTGPFGFPNLRPEVVFEQAKRDVKILGEIGAAGLRAVAGLFEGGLRAFNQSLIELGVNKTTAAKLTRDASAFADVLAVVSGTAPGPVLGARTRKLIRQEARVSEVRRKAAELRESRALNEARKAARKEAKLKAATPVEGEIRATRVDIAERHLNDLETKSFASMALRAPDEILDTIPLYSQEVLTISAQRAAIDTARNILRERGIDPTGLAPQRVQQLIVDLIATSDSFTGRLLVDVQAAGFKNRAEFLDAFLFTGSEAARALQLRSQFFPAMLARLRESIAKGEAGAEGAAEVLKEAAKRAADRRTALLPYEAAEGFMVKSGRIFRKIIISLPQTAIRNFVEATFVRVPINVANRSLDTTMRRIFTPNAPIEPIHPFDEMGRIFMSPFATKKTMDKLLAEFPEVRPKIYAAVEVDIKRQNYLALENPGLLDKIELGVDRVGLWMNRSQEYLVRNGVFPAALDRKLRAIGSSLEEVVDEGIVPAGFDRAISESLETALFTTYALKPRGRGQLAQFFRGYADIIDSSRIGVFMEPFAGFLYNVTRFIIEQTPTAGLRLTSAVNRAKIAEGDFSVLTREITGAALLATAIAMRQGQFPGLTPGPRFDEVITSEGNRVSLAPIAALNAFLFMADTLIRIEEGRIQADALGFKEFRRGLFGSAPQVERGSAAIEAAFDSLSQIRTLGDFQKFGELVGETATGFGRPLQLLMDFRAEFNDAVMVQRESRGRGFSGPTLDLLTRSLPFLDPETLPERESITRAAPPTSPTIALPFGLGEIGAGAFSQLSGLRFREPRNAIETQLVTLGFTAKSLSPKTGNKRLDSLVARFQGPMMEQLGGRVVRSPLYRALPNKTKTEVVRNVLNVTRQFALQQARQIAPAAFAERKFRRIPLIQQEAIFQELNMILREDDPKADSETLLRSLQQMGIRELEAVGL